MGKEITMLKLLLGIFVLAAFAYITALLIFQLLVPKLGINQTT